MRYSKSLQDGFSAKTESSDFKGQRITWGQYMKVGLILTPPVLLTTLVALWLWLPIAR